MRFLVINKKALIILLAVIVALASFITLAFTTSSSMPRAEFNVVIDAGHGGRDNGTSGKTTGVSESELNLKYALTLKDLCEEFGIGVTMTRSDMNGLYDENASNKKKSEMEKRKKGNHTATTNTGRCRSTVRLTNRTPAIHSAANRKQQTASGVDQRYD